MASEKQLNKIALQTFWEAQKDVWYFIKQNKLFDEENFYIYTPLFFDELKEAINKHFERQSKQIEKSMEKLKTI